MIKIKDLKPCLMSELLVKMFRFEEEEALRIEAFLKPMLEYDIHKRVSA